jgi:hypothetical protein
LLGRPVRNPQIGEIYLERFDNGLSRKMVQF